LVHEKPRGRHVRRAHANRLSKSIFLRGDMLWGHQRPKHFKNPGRPFRITSSIFPSIYVNKRNSQFIEERNNECRAGEALSRLIANPNVIPKNNTSRMSDRIGYTAIILIKPRIDLCRQYSLLLLSKVRRDPINAFRRTGLSPARD